MKKFKKLLAVVLSLSMVLGMASVVLADDNDNTTDVSHEGEEYENPIELTMAGVMVEIPANTTMYFSYDYTQAVEIMVQSNVTWSAIYGRDDVNDIADSNEGNTFVIDVNLDWQMPLQLTNTSEEDAFFTVAAFPTQYLDATGRGFDYENPIELTMAGVMVEIPANTTMYFSYDYSESLEVMIQSNVTWSAIYGRNDVEDIADSEGGSTFVIEANPTWQEPLQLTNTSDEDAFFTVAVFPTQYLDMTDKGFDSDNAIAVTMGGVMVKIPANTSMYFSYDYSEAQEVMIQSNVSWTAQYGRDDVHNIADSSEGNTFVTEAGNTWGPLMLTNTSEEDGYFTVATFPVKYLDNDGAGADIDHPIVLTNNDGDKVYVKDKVSIGKGKDGVYYEYVATQDGCLMFTMYGLWLDEDVDAELETLERAGEGATDIPWRLLVWNATKNEAIELDDAVVCPEGGRTYYYPVEVSKGDKVMIWINSFDLNDAENVPEANLVSFEISYPAKGSTAVYPMEIELDKEYTVGGADKYETVYYSYTAEKDGSLAINLAGDGWTYSINGGEEKHDTPEAIALKAGDTVVVMLSSWGDPEVSTAATTVTVSFAFTASDVVAGVATGAKVMLVVAMIAVGVVLVVRKRSSVEA